MIGNTDSVQREPCFECGEPSEHRHHVVPRSRGGTKTVPLCARCHELAHHMHPGDLRWTPEARAAAVRRAEREYERSPAGLAARRGWQ